MDTRRLSLLEGAQSIGCDSLVACTPENMFYMTGFWGEGMAVLDGDKTTIVAPGLEAGRAEADSPASSAPASPLASRSLSTSRAMLTSVSWRPKRKGELGIHQ